MKTLASTAAILIGCTAASGARADFSDVFGRIKDTYNNVTSFQQNIYQTINDEISGGGGNQTIQASQNFWNNQAPQEITDASKLALTQVFPGIADAVGVADKVDQYASQWASQAQNNAQANLDSLSQSFTNLKNQIGSYFGGNASASPQGVGACAIFTDGICPPCPNGPSDANGNCPAVPMPATSSMTSADLASIGATNTGTAPAPTSLSADAQQLPGQLSSWDQQQAAIAAERERQRQLELQRQAQAAAAQEQARQQRELQAAQAYMQSQNATEANNNDSTQADSVQAAPATSGSSWGSILMQGMGLAQQYLGARQATMQAAPPPRCSGNCVFWGNWRPLAEACAMGYPSPQCAAAQSAPFVPCPPRCAVK